ncbi:S1-like domain-containing RNA-binding protein [Alteromonas sp. ASW11-36]|uniref:S1-like domain-containing RNA-binding protein n=1 Tax=Alteromonas arenosi TaxID=3055817 RepID=A0ABT7SXM3_9ALTE|nr:S1-like domain-containing RNA-binding protein [Alteromonas sp. ASW11-36]MDM7860928.1 S1-like domain-containing RNA-binding protein [Alteromonas sp. ASW11-36]
MIKVGAINRLTVAEELPFAWLLQDTKGNQTALLANVNAPKDIRPGMQLEVFVTYDEDGQLAATTQTPKAKVGDLIKLKAVGVTDFGAFFDWGLERDLLVLKRDQERPIAEGLEYFVHIYHDEESQRILGSTRLHYFYPEKIQAEKPLEEKQQVSAKVYAKTELGLKVIIDDYYLGLLFHSEALTKLKVGDSFTGSVKQIRSDGKIDVTMHQAGHAARRSLEEMILDDLEAHGGLSSITDKSTPEEIYAHFKVSKGAYKKAIGTLYKQHKIVLSKTSIKLAEK